MFAYLAFYCAHWQTYVSGKLRFGKWAISFGNHCFSISCVLEWIVRKHNFHLLSRIFSQFSFQISGRKRFVYLIYFQNIEYSICWIDPSTGHRMSCCCCFTNARFNIL